MKSTLNGKQVDAVDGEMLLSVATRNGISIPAICDDPRLEPAGACRTCLVEVNGGGRLVPSCATPVSVGMQIETESERVKRHRDVLFGLYVSDLEQPPERASRTEGDNPFIAFDADRCILCAKCTRYCDEIEQVSAITLAHRGPATTIATADTRALSDTTCEYCGGCVAVCPTGAMTEAYDWSTATDVVRTTCGYCGVGCQLDLQVDPRGNDGRGRVVNVKAPPVGTVPNDGNLCVKGKFAYEYANHPDRLCEPLVRGDDGELHPASWDDALDLVATRLREIRETHGERGLAFISSSRCTGEENYLVQKLARAVFSTNNVHQCAAT